LYVQRKKGFTVKTFVCPDIELLSEDCYVCPEIRLLNKGSYVCPEIRLLK
jgi:hypothetical protein